MRKAVNLVTSAVVQLLFFGALSLAMVLNEPSPSAAVVAGFVAGELGGTSLLCSVIVKRLRHGDFSGWLAEVTVGYIVSHVCILNVLHGPLSGHGPFLPARNALDWMELTLRVGLGLVLLLSVGVLCKARVRKFAEPHIRKLIAAA